MAQRKISCAPLKRRRHVSDDNPTNIQATIAHIAPLHTQDIVTNKRSRFSNQVSAPCNLGISHLELDIFHVQPTPHMKG